MPDPPPIASQRTDQERFQICYDEWLRTQALDLEILLQSLQTAAVSGGAPEDGQLRSLITRSMRHYEDYVERRSAMAKDDAPTFFCPAWCNSLEGSFLWVGGCRPSMAIRLVYALAGADTEAHLRDFGGGSDIESSNDEGEGNGGSGGGGGGGDGSSGNGGGGMGMLTSGIAGLTSLQMAKINDLQTKTVKEEDRISSDMATLQEDVADKPLLTIVKDRHRRTMEALSAAAMHASGNGSVNGGTAFHLNGNGEVEEVMEGFAESLAEMLEEADKLRLSTVKELVEEILNPQQAVKLLIAAKQLHLALHEWGRRRDQRHGRA